ncbi:ATP-binding protein [Streptomyces sp. 7N604]|uniref:ATP-binding protein n=1 Tax=Streptomyces sp. 7N604 TaxID=3457415 RepID=UPI003FD0A5BD
MAGVPKGAQQPPPPQPTPPPQPKHHPPQKRHSLPSEDPWYRRESPRDYSQLRPTVRIRLTLLYGGMFLLAGVVLLTINHLLAAQELGNSGAALRILSGYDLRLSSDVCPEVSHARDIDEFNSILDVCLDNQRAATLNSLLQRSLLSLLGLTVLAFALGYVLAGRTLSPLGRITRMARSVAGSDLNRRIELDGPDDELKELADTFDEMLDRLDRAFNAQQRFVANASHELRTPLAINRTLLEVQMSDSDASPELLQLGRTLLATNERSEQLVTVSNAGPVVPAYEVDNLFEPFRRLRTGRTGSDKGVGLGLSIVRSVTRAHGGTVTAVPCEGGGLEIHVRLPTQ